MQRLTFLLAAAVVLIAAASQALAQADAQAAYRQAQTAFQAGRHAEARDLAKKAAETDPKNPEVFLLLGKAHYELGELDDALAAWKRTLALAPEEPFAQKMLEAVQARRTDVDTRIKLVEALIGEELYLPAGSECESILGNKSLSKAQRAKVMTLKADVLIHSGQPNTAMMIIQEVLTIYPQEADPAETALLMGRAKLHAGGDLNLTAEGVAALKEVVVKHAGTRAAATARFELISFDLAQGADAARADALAKWIAENPKHPAATEGRRKLIEAYLAITRQEVPPTADSPIGQFDLLGLAVAHELLAQSVRVDEAKAVVENFSKQFESQYTAHGAWTAAVTGISKLLAEPLPRAVRLPLLRTLANLKTQIAVKSLEKEAQTGRLASADAKELPPLLADAVAAMSAINREDPAHGAWADLVGLAAQTRTYAASLPWPDRVTAFRAPDAWAVAILLPVIRANADAGSVKTAVEQCQTVIADYSPRQEASAWDLRTGLSRQVTAALRADDPSWPGAMQAQAALLDAYARFLFAENVKAGHGEENAELSKVQKEMLDVLTRLVAQKVSLASVAMNQAAEHVKPWVERGHWVVAEEVYATLAKALPETEHRQAELAAVNLWIQQVRQRDHRLVAAGLTVPRELDPTMKKALVKCYEMQDGLEETNPRLPQIRVVWASVADHYKALDYDDVAEAAIRTKPDAAKPDAAKPDATKQDKEGKEKAVAAADQYAEFQLIRLQEWRARRDLTRQLKEYGAAEKIALTPALKATLDAWTKFITDRPTSLLAGQAVEQVLGIGRLFEQHAAYGVAAAIYSDFAKFAAGVKILAQAAPGTASTAERAALARASALEMAANKALAKSTADRKPGDPPPAKLSDEFAASIAAYKAFIDAYPDGPNVGGAIRQVMAVAIEYARIDAWDVAEGVYADLQKSNLKLRRPERLDFARGLCQLGHAMPDHAREVLTALNAAGLGSEGESREEGETELAMHDRRGDRRGGGGMGGMGMGGMGMGGMGMGGSGFGGGMGGGGNFGLGAPGNGSGASSAPAATLSAPAASTAANKPADAAAQADNPFGDISSPAAQPPARQPVQPSPEAQRDSQLLAMIQQQERQRSARVAQLGQQTMEYNDDSAVFNHRGGQPVAQGQAQQYVVPGAAVPVLSEAELARLEKALDAAYVIFQGIRKNYADSPTAQHARAEIFVVIGHWRGLTQWQRSAAMTERFLADNPSDAQLPQLRLETARDRLRWAAKPIERTMTKQEMLAEVSSRFAAARTDLTKLIDDFPKEKICQQDAQWELANSYLTEARAISAVSPTLARGQFVRAARELRAVAAKYPDHPRLAAVPQMLWGIAQELEGRGFAEEAILVWNELAIYDPINALAQQALMKTAAAYQTSLKRPLKAAETYLELNFIRGGSDQGIQDAVFQIGLSLKNEKRWIEALLVLRTFVDSFPANPQAGQALTMVGQIHQTNESWKDAIAAYKRVIAEYKESQWVQEAKWSIAECTINLSQWREAGEAYRDYAAAYPQDPKLAEANRRIEVLKDLARYQGLVDEKGQRKAFDAQFQIAQIVRTQLSNPVKAIIEYRKVAKNWPESYVAANALYEIGTSYLGLGETAKAREALQAVGKDYPTSPLAGAALFMVGKSFEDEANKLATVTREKAVEEAKDQAQKEAYAASQEYNARNLDVLASRVSSLKKAGKGQAAIEGQEAANTYSGNTLVNAGTVIFAQKAQQDVETLTATQLADRQDKINAALRKAIDAYAAASKIPGGNKADAALLQMATIYDQRLKDSKAAVQTWLEIVRQFSGTAVAEDASWKLAQYYEREGKYAEAIEAYNAFLRNYRRSPNAGSAQFAVAECYEHLGQWVAAMDSYNNYLNNFADGPLAAKAKEQINWIKTYRL
jgi:autotransporter-associated beta strand protein